VARYFVLENFSIGVHFEACKGSRVVVWELPDGLQRGFDAGVTDR
jgi:hypothetical protein